MADTGLDLTGTQAEVAAILAAAGRSAGVEASEPTALDASRALNAGISPAEITAALQFVSLVFTTGTAILTFIKALREELQVHNAGAVVVSDPGTGKPIGKVSAASTDAELETIARR